jgi:hypothetical protein
METPPAKLTEVNASSFGEMIKNHVKVEEVKHAKDVEEMLYEVDIINGAVKAFEDYWFTTNSKAVNKLFIISAKVSALRQSFFGLSKLDNGVELDRTELLRTARGLFYIQEIKVETLEKSLKSPSRNAKKLKTDEVSFLGKRRQAKESFIRLKELAKKRTDAFRLKYKEIWFLISCHYQGNVNNLSMKSQKQEKD